MARSNPSTSGINNHRLSASLVLCALLIGAVACEKSQHPAPPPEIVNEPSPADLSEPSENLTEVTPPPAITPEPEPIPAHTMYPAVGFNEAFVIDFTKHFIADGWYIANHDVPGAQWKNDFRADNVSFTQDGLVITVTEKPDPEPGQWPWNSGEVTSNSTFHFGYYEVEMKIAKGSGLVTAMFTYTGPYFGTIHDEVDLEFVGTRTKNVEFNVFRRGRPRGSKRQSLKFDASAEFHTYAFDWQPDYVDWYVDGVKVHRLTKSEHVPQVPSKIMMNLWAGNIEAWHGPAKFEPGTQAVFRCLSFSPGTERSQTCSSRAE